MNDKNKKRAESYRIAADYLEANCLYDPTGAISLLKATANELDPPRPEPGTVVWCHVTADDKWHIGVVVDYGIVPADNINASWNWDFKDLEWKPARILASDEVVVKVPPVKDWPEHMTGIEWQPIVRNTYSNWRGVSKTIITRAEAERMEAEG